jgi:hypothetical protein
VEPIPSIPQLRRREKMSGKNSGLSRICARFRAHVAGVTMLSRRRKT